MAEQNDEGEQKADLDWLYRRGPEEAPDPLAGRPARVTSTFNRADVQRHEQEFLAERARRQAQQQARPAQVQPGGSAQYASRGQQPGGYGAANAVPRHAGSGPTGGGNGAPPRRPVPAPVPATQPPRRRRPRHPVRNFFRTFFIVLLAWLVYTVAVPVRAFASMPQVDWEPAAAGRPSQQPGTAILLVGSDSRENLTEAQKAALGTGDAEGQRTDTIMILYTPPWGGRSVLISVPRDSYVTIPGYGRNKINAAYSFGGAPLLTQTIEGATGLRMDGYMEIGFAGFADMIDAVKGVQVCLDEPMADPLANIDLPAGCQTLNGDNALGYVRHRYGDPEGDLGRAKRQREVIAKVGKKVMSPTTVANPVRWWNVNEALSKAITRGKDMGPGVALGAGRGMVSVAGGKGLTLQVPVSNSSGWSDDGQSVVIWDSARASRMFGLLAQGDTKDMDQFAS
ncbi:LytR family transcriptional regulator [Propionibacterium freudenreichii]|uniref:Cell envelope-related transcriptional attenuator n=4 Tax=Propionibacterium freudenreichii TaxID=1744 RepID=D7GCK2_PROFC|nr:LCP family protein [Propionibacterium freudenreichii]AJQ90426.1 Cell envelope-related transcriptional regulator [Propionibacterium freudenreichii subsp. freudenreichii]MCQ1997011.1 LCP family protein [Propionibacterium freudenreichii]MCT2973169.1 LytR family transcriptional regulator [Propionibacterium freudenreichii]MCT2975256.1 LytR family transcriptional regulator [Propionibacterium freudenreichii]MCT2983290.1 LytR family transcriptional regulator [Propionibacterium freudenreichii]